MKILMLVALTVATLSGLYGQRDLSREIISYTEKARVEWKIPGISLAVIKGDSIVVAEGFGVKERGGKDSVKAETIFHIGSMSKAFTAALMASVVDEGLVRWDDKVKELMPDFEWYCDSVEREMEVKDLFTHSTGLVAQVGTYIPNLGYSREDIYRMFKYIEPYYPFREKFAYNNITFLIAARIIEKATGKSWEENIEERIFRPLGMTSSSPTAAGYLEAGKEAATAHYFGYSKGKNGGRGSIRVSPLKGEERALEWVSTIGPAGGISSNVHDMAEWVKFHLNKGSIMAEGRFMDIEYRYPVHVISESQMEYLHSPASKIYHDSATGYTKDYGYCWYIEKFTEPELPYRWIYHTGTTWGFTGVCGFVPELDLGIVLLCNSEVSELARMGIIRHIADLYFAAETMPERADSLTDWSSENLKRWFDLQQRPRRRKVPCTIEREKSIPEFTKLTGLYTKEAPFGDAEVFMKKGLLYMKIGPRGWTHRLTHHRGNEFHLRSQGHTFPVFFHNYSSGESPVSFEIDFNYNENFGPWTKQILKSAD